MGSRYFFSLDAIKPQKSGEGGSLTYATARETPGLSNISFSNLKLRKGGALEPIWHPNANKIGYCTQGKALVFIRSPESADVFTVQKGDIFFVPKGYIHHIENASEGETVIAFGLDDSIPETMSLAKAVYSISDSVFNSTFKTQTKFVDGLKKSRKDDVIKTLSGKNDFKETTNKYKFDIGNSAKTVMTPGGYLQLGTQSNLPVLTGLGILGFGLNPKGIVEPHWHTNAGELVYIVRGRTKITVLSPDGNVDVMEVNGGQGAFAPASYFHNIENIGSDDVEVIAFFSNANPDYIGIGEVVGSYSNDVLGSIFNVPPGYFDSFKKPEKPLVIVPV